MGKADISPSKQIDDYTYVPKPHCQMICESENTLYPTNQKTQTLAQSKAEQGFVQFILLPYIYLGEYLLKTNAHREGR